VAGLQQPPAVLLIGLRGAGKSAVARALADRLGRLAVDLDALTPVYLGESTTGDALRLHGEPAFRDAESRALRDMLASWVAGDPGRIIALGGGTPTAPGAAELIREERAAGRARVIYLRATEATLRARLAATDVSQRPSLTGAGTLEEIGTLLARRDGLYRGLAELTLDVDTLSLAEVVDRLAAFIEPR
jgi:shikimate kinase